MKKVDVMKNLLQSGYKWSSIEPELLSAEAMNIPVEELFEEVMLALKTRHRPIKEDKFTPAREAEEIRFYVAAAEILDWLDTGCEKIGQKHQFPYKKAIDSVYLNRPTNFDGTAFTNPIRLASKRIVRVMVNTIYLDKFSTQKLGELRAFAYTQFEEMFNDYVEGKKR